MTAEPGTAEWVAYYREIQPAISAWRRSLTDEECREYHAAWTRGERAPGVVEGHREWDRRYQLKRRREKKAA